MVHSPKLRYSMDQRFIDNIIRWVCVSCSDRNLSWMPPVTPSSDNDNSCNDNRHVLLSSACSNRTTEIYCTDAATYKLQPLASSTVFCRPFDLINTIYQNIQNPLCNFVAAWPHHFYDAATYSTVLWSSGGVSDLQPLGGFDSHPVHCKQPWASC